MKIKTVFLLASLCHLFVPLAAPAADRPNIVVVLVDDLGFSDIGCYGGEVPTPNLDRLAAEGVRFTQFYNTARCSPTRASLISGLYPHQAGMGWLDNMVVPQSQGIHGRLLPRCVTIAQVLRGAGYFTAMTGKWHLGQQHGTTPWNRGFDRSLNSRYGEVYFPKEMDRPGTDVLYLNGKELPKSSPTFGADWYSTDLFTEWGLKFIDEAREQKKPFFLYLAQGAVHFPLRAPREVIEKYRGKYMAGWDALRERRHAKQIEMGLVDAKWPLTPRPPESPSWESRAPERRERFDQIMAVYAAMIDRIDFAMGTLVEGLRKRGALDNTLILFLSDNGGNAEGGPPGVTQGEGPIGSPQSRVLLGMNWATLANTPFRRYKHFTHEGGISAPLIAHWPTGIPHERHGALEKQPAHLIDIMAPAVDLSGAQYPREFEGHAIEPMQGVSLRPAFAGESLARQEPIFWEHEGNKAVRDGKWKLVMRHRQPWQLFDMEADRTEQHDLIDEQPELAAKLKAAWQAWAKRTYVDDWPGPDHTDWGQDIKRP
ncbi:MAG TPA: arylsulfatase [Pirellulales bacterium]